MVLPTHPVDHNMVLVLEEVPQDNEETHQTLVVLVEVKAVVVAIVRLVEDLVPLVVNVQVSNFVEALPAEEEKVVVVEDVPAQFMVVVMELLVVEMDVTLVAGEQDIMVVLVEVDHPMVEMVEVDQDILVVTHHTQLKVLQHTLEMVRHHQQKEGIVHFILDKFLGVVDIATTEEMVVIKVDLVK